MFEQFMQQMQKFNVDFKPAMELYKLNTEAAEQLFKAQATYLQETLAAGMAQAEAMTSTQDAETLLKQQKAFAEETGNRMVKAAQENLEIVTKARQDAIETIDEAIKKQTKK